MTNIRLSIIHKIIYYAVLHLQLYHCLPLDYSSYYCYVAIHQYKSQRRANYILCSLPISLPLDTMAICLHNLV